MSVFVWHSFSLCGTHRLVLIIHAIECKVSERGELNVGQVVAMYVEQVNKKMAASGIDAVFGGPDPTSPTFLSEVLFTLLEPNVFPESAAVELAEVKVGKRFRSLASITHATLKEKAEQKQYSVRDKQPTWRPGRWVGKYTTKR